MSGTLTAAAPAGWYDDPADPSAFRWWSGEGWTTYTSPKQAPAVATPAVPVAPSAPAASTYVPMSRDPALQSTYAPAQVAPARGSAQTPGIWLIALLPVMNLGLLGLIVLAAFLGGVLIPDAAAWAVSFVLALLFAWLDSRELKRRGYRAPHIAWMLLPLAYLIVRGRRVRAQGGRAWPAEVVYVLAVILRVAALLGLGAAAAASAPMVPGQSYYAGSFAEGSLPQVSEMEAMLSTALAPDGTIPVACAPSAGNISPGDDISCLASDTLSAMQLQLDVTYCDCGDVFFTFQQVSGNPDGTPAQVESAHGTGNGIVVPQQVAAGRIVPDGLDWEGQVSLSIQDAGGYQFVDCKASASLIDLRSTFTCDGYLAEGNPVMLDVTVDDVGDIAYTEYPAGSAAEPPSQAA